MFNHLVSFIYSNLIWLPYQIYLFYNQLTINKIPKQITYPLNMGDDAVWFDGVDKKLIEIHAKSAKPQDLITKTPLASCSTDEKKKTKKVKSDTIRPNQGLTDEVAIDCEMVECHHHKSVLARVSIVNLFGHPILDSYVKPPSPVTDYRTRWSGIRRKDLLDAPDFESVQKEVADIIQGRIVIGHAVHNDFGVLKLNHPADKIRDTSIYFKYLFQGKSPSLKKLSQSVLGINIQKGEHDSIQDAQATMKLYVKERDRWNAMIAKQGNRITNRHKNHKIQNKKPQKKKIKTFYVLTN